jgi:hypothetical protein
VAPPQVVDNLDAAAELVAQGVDVVLVIESAALQGDLPAEGPGRLAVFLGSVTDPDVRVAAEAMAAELFGGR